MVKIKYPESGIVKTQTTLFEKLNESIKKIMEVNINIPDGIHDTILNELTQITQDINNDYKNIKENLENIDREYEMLDLEIQNKIKEIVVNPIPKRDKII